MQYFYYSLRNSTIMYTYFYISPRFNEVKGVGVYWFHFARPSAGLPSRVRSATFLLCEGPTSICYHDRQFKIFVKFEDVDFDCIFGNTKFYSISSLILNQFTWNSRHINNVHVICLISVNFQNLSFGIFFFFQILNFGRVPLQLPPRCVIVHITVTS